jgi:hypothetical protein
MPFVSKLTTIKSCYIYGSNKSRKEPKKQQKRCSKSSKIKVTTLRPKAQ